MRSEQNYERGDRKIPGDVLLQLAQVYGIDPLWALEGPGLLPRKLSPQGIDVRILKKALMVLDNAIEKSGKAFDIETRCELAAEAYRQYMLEDSSEDESSLLATFLRVG